MEEDNNKCDIDDEEDDNPSIDDTPNWNILKNEVDQLLDKIQDVVQAERFSFKNAFSQNVKSTQDLAPSFSSQGSWDPLGGFIFGPPLAVQPHYHDLAPPMEFPGVMGGIGGFDMPVGVPDAQTEFL